MCDVIAPPSDITDVTGFHAVASPAGDVIADVISVIRRCSLFDAVVTSTVNSAVSRSTVTLTLCHLSSFKPKTTSNSAGCNMPIRVHFFRLAILTGKVGQTSLVFGVH